jgi:pyruvate, orthophosphate dikinase
MSDERTRKVYFIGGGRSDAHGVTPQLVGSKAFNLMRMDAAGLRVPVAFVIGTETCREVLRAGGELPADCDELLAASIRWLENTTGRTFGGHRGPLLVSVRSGAPVSMPGMMDTVLNVGLNDATVSGLIRATGNPRLAWDSYRRLVESYASVVHGSPLAPFEELAQRHLDSQLFPSARELDTVTLRLLAREALELVHSLTGVSFPQDPLVQLRNCVGAVFRSWDSSRARTWRCLHGIDDSLGTAVMVQAMVFGNSGGSSGSGVGFTRDPASGENTLYLDFMFNAQGEDVVSGRRKVSDGTRLQTLLPQLHARLQRVKSKLESEFRDLQDFEFTVQDGELFLLQTRDASRAPWAALRVAVEMVDEGLIEVPTALARLAALDLAAVARVSLEAPAGLHALATAIPASIGAVSGVIATDSDAARRLCDAGQPVILVREDTATEDIEGMALSCGILTSRGGRTSHAAVVARQLDKVCLVGCSALTIDAAAGRCRFGDTVLREGDWLSLDGNRGLVFAGQHAVVRERPEMLLQRVQAWRQEHEVGLSREASAAG